MIVVTPLSFRSKFCKNKNVGNKSEDQGIKVKAKEVCVKEQEVKVKRKKACTKKVYVKEKVKLKLRVRP